jgi:hypothetical protein
MDNVKKVNSCTVFYKVSTCNQYFKTKFTRSSKKLRVCNFVRIKIYHTSFRGTGKIKPVISLHIKFHIPSSVTDYVSLTNWKLKEKEPRTIIFHPTKEKKAFGVQVIQFTLDRRLGICWLMPLHCWSPNRLVAAWYMLVISTALMCVRVQFAVLRNIVLESET